MLTEAERLFETFCSGRGIQCIRIPEGDGRTPDYELRLPQGTVAVEVKQFEPNENDLAFRKQLETQRFASRWGDMGARVKQKISDGMKQLRPYAKGRMPALLVVHDAFDPHSLVTDPDAVRFAMYGPERVHLAVAPNAAVRPVVLGASYGGDRGVDPLHNTTLSAVAVLRAWPSEADMQLLVFHNVHAARPLPCDWLRLPGVQHFTLAADKPDDFPRWRAV